MPHPGELNLDAPAPPVEVEVNIDGKEYVLREAPAGDVTDILLLATGLGSKDRPAPIDGPASLVSLVVARCLYERTDQGERPVPLDTILSWPHRIVRSLFEKAKEINKLRRTLKGPRDVRHPRRGDRGVLRGGAGRSVPARLNPPAIGASNRGL
jgi:hypothetical protein